MLKISTARNAPRNDMAEYINPPYIPKNAETVTAKPAPEFTPIMLGEASLFESTFCITAPETERAAPVKRAASVLGRREYKNIIPSGVKFPSLIPSVTDENEIVTLPIVKPKQAATIKSVTAEIYIMMVFLFCE